MGNTVERRLDGHAYPTGGAYGCASHVMVLDVVALTVYILPVCAPPHPIRLLSVSL